MGLLVPFALLRGGWDELLLTWVGESAQCQELWLLGGADQKANGDENLLLPPMSVQYLGKQAVTQGRSLSQHLKSIKQP